MSTSVTVAYLPMCDICKDRPAKYDARTRQGPWAYMCAMCYRVNRMYSTLGTGMGQRLVLSEKHTDKSTWVGLPNWTAPGQEHHTKGEHTERDYDNDA